VKRIDGPEIDEIRRDMLTGQLIRKAARVGWKSEWRRWISPTTTARRLEPARRARLANSGFGLPGGAVQRGRGVRQLSRRGDAKIRRLDWPSAH